MSHNGSSYRCIYGHISQDDPEDEPGEGANWKLYWIPMATEGAPASEEEKSIFDEFFDWITDIPNWGFGDWLKAVLGVATLGWGIVQIIDMMDDDGIGDGNAGSVFDGPPAYDGGTAGGGIEDATLSKIIQDLCEPLPFNVDTSLLPTKLISFRITNPTPRRNILGQLGLIYGFSMVPSGSTLKFIPWDTPAVKTLTMDDLGYGMSESDTARYEIDRTQGIDLPRRILLTYNDRSLNYQDNVATYEITAFDEGSEISINVPFVLTYEEAQSVAERALTLSHLEATRFSYTVSFEDHMELEPGDNINTPLGLHRIVSVEIRRDGGMDISAVDASFIAEMSTPSGDGYGDLPEVTDIPVQVGYSTAIFVDLPPLNSDDTEPRIFAAVHGYGLEGWPGASIYKSNDGGSTYNVVNTASSEATVGMVESAIPAPPDYHIFDDTTVITVQLKTNQLLSVTDDALYQGVVNTCLVGSEMLAFGEATLIALAPNGNEIYELTHLLRGLQGTEWSVDGHADTELFILIDSSLVKIPYVIDERGHVKQYKIVTHGSDVSKGDVQDVSPFGINLVPWTVSRGKGEKLGATSDWLVSWDERARFSGDELQDYNESKHDYDWAGWVISILDPQDLDVEIRTEQAISNSFTYTESMQIADFGSVQTCITVKVNAMSSIVGGGYGSTFTCNG